MAYEALIVPHEAPVSLREIKRALITYDKIYVVDPSDRDVIPENAYMSTIIGMPIMGMNMGAVRPMGKMLGYDEIFERIIDECRLAVSQGLIEIISTYQKPETQGFTIGGVPTGGYPLDPRFVFQLYRQMSQDQDFLRLAVSADVGELVIDKERLSDIAMTGIGDGAINNVPALPSIDLQTIDEDDRDPVALISRARIAALIKYAGYCHEKNLLPIFPIAVYRGLVDRLIQNTHEMLASTDNDAYWLKRNRILELSHNEFLDEDALDKLTVKDVIQLRSSLWGAQANAREKLFQSVNDIAQNTDGDEDFHKHVSTEISEYRKASNALEREREQLKHSIKCDIGIGALGMGTTFPGLLLQLQSPLPSMAVTLAGGAIWALQKKKEYQPILQQIKDQEAELRRGPGFGLHAYYRSIGDKS